MSCRGIAVATAAALVLASPAAAACPSAALSHAMRPAADLSEPEGAEVATRESGLAACLFDFGGGHLRLGMDYAYTRHEYDGVAGRDRDLHRLQLPLFVSGDAGAWRLDGYIAPGVATSSNVFKDLGSRATSEDFLLTGRLEARFRRTARMNWLLGIGHDRSAGESRIRPVAGIEYRWGDRLGLRLAWPDPALVFAVSGRQSLVLDLYPAGQRWHVVSDELGEAFDYRLEGWRAQATWSYRLVGPVTVELGIGLEFATEHGFTDDTGRRLDADADDGLVLALGLRFGDGGPSRGRGPTLPRLAPSVPTR